jgi:hypothetical protein
MRKAGPKSGSRQNADRGFVMVFGRIWDMILRLKLLWKVFFGK